MTKKLSPIASNALIAEINKEMPQLTKIEQYLAQDADINYQSDVDGYTALMLAVDRDDEPLVNYLLIQGANPLIQNHHKEKASDIALSHSPIYLLLKNYELLFATMQNDLAGVKAALDAGANINFQGQGGYCALLIAVEQSCLEIVEFLMRSGAYLGLELDDNRGVLELASDKIIYKTLDCGIPLPDDVKRKLLDPDDEDEEKWEKGRLKTLADRKGQPFALSQLKMHPLGKDFRPASTEAQLEELANHFGHPLPQSLKEIFIHYNGCRPLLDYYADDEDSSIYYFYYLDENRDSVGNIWCAIKAHAEYLNSDTLPIAEDSYGGVFFLKWVEGNAQVWLFQYGDQPFAYEDNEEEDENKMPYAFRLIKTSLDEWLEALYAVEE
ncbi:MAG: SMI1/KNR4 family protein [Tatlockia sp.]|nr:SMI1/KNR4 family protein [Tatlockia sp.]